MPAPAARPGEHSLGIQVWKCERYPGPWNSTNPTDRPGSLGIAIKWRRLAESGNRYRNSAEQTGHPVFRNAPERGASACEGADAPRAGSWPRHSLRMAAFHELVRPESALRAAAIHSQWPPEPTRELLEACLDGFRPPSYRPQHSSLLDTESGQNRISS
jgi:hypothetical protein